MSGAAIAVAYGSHLPPGRMQTLRARWPTPRASVSAPASHWAPVSQSVHLLFLFCFAIDAGSKDEAKRLYTTMDDGARAEIDSAEATQPGLFKIWERATTP